MELIYYFYKGNSLVSDIYHDRYNDISVLENFHASFAFSTMNKPLNQFAPGMTAYSGLQIWSINDDYEYSEIWG